MFLLILFLIGLKCLKNDVNPIKSNKGVTKYLSFDLGAGYLAFSVVQIWDTKDKNMCSRVNLDVKTKDKQSYIFTKEYLDEAVNLEFYGIIGIPNQTKKLSLPNIAKNLKFALDEFFAENDDLTKSELTILIEQQANKSRVIDAIESQLYMYFVDNECYTVNNMKKNIVCFHENLAHEVFYEKNIVEAKIMNRKPRPPRTVHKKHADANFKYYLRKFTGDEYSGESCRSVDIADSFMQIFGYLLTKK